MNRHGLIAVSLLAAGVAGCTGGMRRANVRLRDDNARLEDRVAQLELANAELAAQLARAPGNTPDSPDSDALQAIPQLAAISISPVSGWDPSPEDGPVLQIHVASQDGLGRPIQLAGSMDAQLLRPIPGTAPEVITSTSLDPQQVRQAWRGGPLGTTWLIELPVSENLKHEPLLIHVEHRDLRTGRVHRASTTTRGSR